MQSPWDLILRLDLKCLWTPEQLEFPPYICHLSRTSVCNPNCCGTYVAGCFVWYFKSIAFVCVPLQLFCYSTMTAVGISAVYNQPWLWDTRQCWYGWPEQQMTWVLHDLWKYKTTDLVLCPVRWYSRICHDDDDVCILGNPCMIFLDTVFLWEKKIAKHQSFCGRCACITSATSAFIRATLATCPECAIANIRRQSMRWLYALETAYYLATTVMLAFWEVPRKDFQVMMTHHLATVVSIIFTYKYK